jgi:hypothetical protein
VAEQESTRKRSEGEATAKVELARAEKISLDTIAEAIEADDCSQTDYMIAKKYNELLRATPGSGSDDKIVYVPYEVSAISGLISQLPTVYGRSAGGVGGGAAASAAGGGGGAGGVTAVRRVPTAGPAAAGGRAGAAGGGRGQFAELD